MWLAAGRWFVRHGRALSVRRNVAQKKRFGCSFNPLSWIRVNTFGKRLGKHRFQDVNEIKRNTAEQYKTSITNKFKDAREKRRLINYPQFVLVVLNKMSPYFLKTSRK